LPHTAFADRRGDVIDAEAGAGNEGQGRVIIQAETTWGRDQSSLTPTWLLTRTIRARWPFLPRRSRFDALAARGESPFSLTDLRDRIGRDPEAFES
jgi:hypothetical protein